MTRTVLIVIIFLFGVVGILWATSLILSRAAERTVVYQYIADALDQLDDQTSDVVWEPASEQLVRDFTPGDEFLIGRTLTEAWTTLALAQSTGQAEILADTFSGVAQERAEQSVRDAQHGGRMVVLSQTARPKFYHLDGSVFQSEAEMLTARFMIENDSLSYYELTEDQTVTTLINESNGWRIYTHERYDATPVKTGLVGWDGGVLAGINYYPAQTPWQQFWPNFDASVIAEDFDRLVGLNANSVRIFLTTEPFLDPKIREQSLDNLETLLVLAEESGLKVIPTLFDLKHAFDPAGWGQDYTYLLSVLPILNNSPSVAFVDLKNEPDLDFVGHGRGNILAWLQTMVHLARMTAPEMALTIGWSNSESAPLLEEHLDVVTYHDYADVSSSSARLAAVREATDRPVMITEIGVSSFNLGFSFPGSEGRQADALTARTSALRDADGIFIWTLYDFPKVDTTAVGGSPWVKRLQSEFGLLNDLGQEKIGATIVSEFFDGFQAETD